MMLKSSLVAFLLLATNAAGETIPSMTPKAMHLTDHFGKPPTPWLSTAQHECPKLTVTPTLCVQNAHCGWCGAKSQCVAGTFEAPAIKNQCEETTSYVYTAPSHEWVPVPVTQEVVYKTAVTIVKPTQCHMLTARPVDCVQNKLCGWCGESAKCIAGDEYKPAKIQSCKREQTYVYTQPAAVWNPYEHCNTCKEKLELEPVRMMSPKIVHFLRPQTVPCATGTCHEPASNDLVTVHSQIVQIDKPNDCHLLNVDPNSCVQSPVCGWCSTKKACVAGSVSGPSSKAQCQTPSAYYYHAPSLTWNPWKTYTVYTTSN